MTFETLWRALANEVAGKPFQGILFRRIRPEARCSLFLGLEEPGNNRLLLLQVERDCIPDKYALPEVRAIQVRTSPAPGDEHGKGAILLILKEERYQDVFDVLVRDLTEALVSTISDAEAVSVFLGRLAKWQRFLKVSEGEGLSAEAQRGLYGELWFLKEFILPRFGAAAVRLWVGCEGAAQDFQSVHGAVEVKTTLAADYPTLQIHGVRQLDETAVPLLLLFHLTITAHQGSNETLVQLVTSIRTILSGSTGAAERFEAALVEAGYYHRHRPLYEAVGYCVQATSLYEIKGDFPRIRADELRTGIGEVKYSVAAAACASHVVNFARIASILPTP